MGHKHMPPKPRPKEKRDWGLLLLILALFLFVGALFVGGEHGSKSQSSTRPDPATLNQINKYLKEAALKEEIRRRELEAENALPEPTGNHAGQKSDVRFNPYSLEQQNHAEQVIRDTDNSTRQGRPITPDQRISAKLERDQWVREYEKRQQDEYIRQFLENARRQGVDVQLNENLDVTGLKVNPPEEPMRIPQSVPRGSK